MISSETIMPMNKKKIHKMRKNNNYNNNKRERKMKY